ncbi:MAG: glycerophosphodiester phosphodiesterase, partial [Promethearchaeota archaeon]
MVIKENRPFIIGHRGAYDEAPENTLKGFRRAIELGADYIEFDVHRSKDGALVIIHGTDILRRMGYNSTIEQMTLEELKKLDFGEGEKVPELKDIISIAKGKVKLLCELKAKGISEEVIKLLQNEN